MDFEVGEKILYEWDEGKWTANSMSLLLRGLPEKFSVQLIEIKNENDFFRIVYEDIVIREIEPLLSRRMKCFFEDISFIEFTRDELEQLLKAMYKPTEL